MQVTYLPITTAEERKAPQGKYRVILNNRSSEPSQFYLVGDYDSAEEAIRIAETFGMRTQNGIVQTSNGWILYPNFDGPHQFYTRKDLLNTYGHDRRNGEKALTSAHVDEIERKQSERIPGWKQGHKLLVFWKDISDATGAQAY